jgi:hypothetical protein
VKGGTGACDVDLLQSVLESLLRRAAAANNTANPANNTTATFMVRCLQLLPLPIPSTMLTRLLLPSFEAALGRKVSMHKQLLAAAVVLDSKRAYHGYTSFSGQPSAQQRLHSLGYMFDIDAWKVEHVQQQYVPKPVGHISAIPMPVLTQQHEVVQAASQPDLNVSPIVPVIPPVDAQGVLNVIETTAVPDAPSTPTALEGDVSFFTTTHGADTIPSEGDAATITGMSAVAESSDITAEDQQGDMGTEQATTTTSKVQAAVPTPMTPQQALIEDIRSEYKLTCDGKVCNNPLGVLTARCVTTHLVY